MLPFVNLIELDTNVTIQEEMFPNEHPLIFYFLVIYELLLHHLD